MGGSTPETCNLQEMNFAGTEALGEPHVYRLDCGGHDATRLINFHELEQHEGVHFRWTEPVAMVRLDVPPGSYAVAIDTASFRGPRCDFRFQLHWNEFLIPRSEVEAESGQIRFSVSPSMFAAQIEQRLTIACKPLTVEGGRRQLGMPVRWIELRGTSTGWNGDGRSAGKVGCGHRPLRTVPKRSRWFRSTKAVDPSIPIWRIRLPTPSPVSWHDATSRAFEHIHCERVIVAPVEINSRHGTGLLIQYLFNDLSKVATVASQRCYNDDRVLSAVHHYLPDPKLSRHAIFQCVQQWFSSGAPQWAYVVPYFQSDLVVGLALKEVFQTKICLHLMDDNCLYGNEIPSACMGEAIRKADICFAISPEMRSEYQRRFGVRVWNLPPIVPAELIDGDEPAGEESFPMAVPEPEPQYVGRCRTRSTGPSAGLDHSVRRGILLGNVWDRQWLGELRRALRDSGLQVDWFSNNPESVWLNETTEGLARDGIHFHAALWGSDLVNELRNRPFALIPTSQLAQQDERENIARLSLPSRVPFIAATAGIPIIVVGSRETAAARFVQRFRLGEVVDYEGRGLRSAVQEVTRETTCRAIRSNARSIANRFSSRDLEAWLWQSVRRGEPSDGRFETLFSPQSGDFVCYMQPEPPPKIHWAFRDAWRMLRRLRDRGLRPEIIIDVGSSTGIWSCTAATVFPEARFVLIDPLMSRYDPTARTFHQQTLENYDLVEAALSDHIGMADLIVSRDLYGSSLLKVDPESRLDDVAPVEVLTLDEVARRLSLRGRTLLKVDVQFGEHLVLSGAPDFLRENVEAMILELTLNREHPRAKTYREMLDLLEQLGYELIDEVEGWRSPTDGQLRQKDSLFIRARAMTHVRAA